VRARKKKRSLSQPKSDFTGFIEFPRSKQQNCTITVDEKTNTVFIDGDDDDDGDDDEDNEDKDGGENDDGDDNRGDSNNKNNGNKLSTQQVLANEQQPAPFTFKFQKQKLGSSGKGTSNEIELDSLKQEKPMFSFVTNKRRQQESDESSEEEGEESTQERKDISPNW